MKVTFTPVRVDVPGGDDGLLVFADERLSAVLTRLGSDHDEQSAHWFLEAGFGRLDGRPQHPTFVDLLEAESWIKQRLLGRDSGATHPPR